MDRWAAFDDFGAGVMLFLLMLILIAGCYRPNVADGGFLCDLAPSARACPEGFACDHTLTPPRCWAGSHDAGASDRGSDAPEAGRDATPDADGPPPGVAELGACTGSSQCAAGLTCMSDNCGGRCYRLCTSDGDCPASSCSRTTPGGQAVCDVPAVACVPTSRSAGGQTGCALAAQACFLSAIHADQTLCDCPGGARAGETCAISRDCLAGLVCVDPTGMGVRHCQQVCVVGDDASCAPNVCRAYVGPDGVSNPTYGFCF